MDEINNRDFIEKTTTTITIFGENALKTAAKYISHGKRKIVTKEDLKRALILELLLFNKRKIDKKYFNKVKNKLFKKNNNSDMDDNDDDDNDDDDNDNDDDNDENEDKDDTGFDYDSNLFESENKIVPNYIVDNSMESFSFNKCNCTLCDCINNIHNEWKNWKPNNTFEKIFQKHINNI